MHATVINDRGVVAFESVSHFWNMWLRRPTSPVRWRWEQNVWARSGVLYDRGMGMKTVYHDGAELRDTLTGSFPVQNPRSTFFATSWL